MMNYDEWGIIPQMLSMHNPQSAAEQLHRGYAHGGGWRPFEGFEAEGYTLSYEGDPPMNPVATQQFREETVAIYPHEWVAVFQKDGSFEISRMD